MLQNNIFRGLLLVLLFTACQKDEELNVNNKVAAYIEFEHVFNNEEFHLNHPYHTSSNGEVKINMLKYFITEITFHGSNGTLDYEVPIQEGFHIVDASCESTFNKYLSSIPDGTYNKMSFRYGVSEEVFEQGTAAQGEMLVTAKEFDMSWAWTVGYVFMKLEGSYGGMEHNTFKIHNGSHGSGAHTVHKTTAMEGHSNRIDNSMVINFPFPNDTEIIVSTATSPKVHVKVDVRSAFEEEHALDLSSAGGNIIIDAHLSPKVAENAAAMFSLAHIHPFTDAFELPDLQYCEDTSNPNDGHGGHGH